MPSEAVSTVGDRERRCHVCEKDFGPMTDARWDEEWSRHERTQGHLEKVGSGTGPALPYIVCKFPGCEKSAIGPWAPEDRATLTCKDGHDLSKGEVENMKLPWWWLKHEYPEKYADLSKTGPTHL